MRPPYGAIGFVTIGGVSCMSVTILSYPILAVLFAAPAQSFARLSRYFLIAMTLTQIVWVRAYFTLSEALG